MRHPFTSTLHQQIPLPLSKRRHHIHHHLIRRTRSIKRRIKHLNIDLTLSKISNSSHRLIKIATKTVKTSHNKSIARTHVTKSISKARTLPLRTRDSVRIQMPRITPSINKRLTLSVKRLPLTSS